MILYMILFIILLLLFVLTIYFGKNNNENFTANTLINGYESKRDIIDKKKDIFLESRNWRPIDPNYKYRSDVTNIKSGYLPYQLKQILNPLIRNIKLDKFKQIKDRSKLNTDLFLELTDKYVNQIMNNINKDLYKLRKHRNVICPNLNACPIEIVDKKISSFAENSKYYKFIIILIINLGNKEFNNVIELGVVYNKFNQKDFLVSLDVVGNLPEDEFGYIRYTPQLIISRDLEYPYHADKGYLRYNEDDTVIPNIDKDNTIKKYLEKQIGSSTEKREPEFRCYGSKGNNQLECENDYDLYFKPKLRGVWDRDCISDDECPFFKKNKNYYNSRGGCVLGKCEMPLGIESLGQRYFNIDTKPLCYNCPDKKYDCCQEQTSPDYIFENDIMSRIFNKKDLDNNNLKLN
jgi:hypothetical protein